MEYYTLLLLGGLVGMQHALEADHLAAVAAMTTGRTSRKALVLRGSVWGRTHHNVVVDLWLASSIRRDHFTSDGGVARASGWSNARASRC